MFNYLSKIKMEQRQSQTVSFLELYSDKKNKRKIKVIINDEEYNNDSVLSNLLGYNDSRFKSVDNKQFKGQVLRSLIDYGIDIEHWQAYVKVKKMGMRSLSYSEKQNLEEILIRVGGEEKIWKDFNNYLTISRHKSLKVDLKYMLNPSSKCHDEFKIAKKWVKQTMGGLGNNQTGKIIGNCSDGWYWIGIIETEPEMIEKKIAEVSAKVKKLYLEHNLEMPDDLLIDCYNRVLIYL